MSTSHSHRIAAPRPPESSAPFRFPFIASLAPLVAALALWLMTSSPFALLFAVLGPVTAVASFADSKFGARKSARRESARFAVDAAAAVEAIAVGHAAERAELAEAGPAAEAIVARYGADPYRWTATAASGVMVSVGIGRVSSSLQFDREARGPATAADATLDEIKSLVATITESSVLVDARLGIGVCGSGPFARAVARAISLQLAWALSPARFWTAGAALEAQWIEALPHRYQRRARAGYVVEFGALDDDRVVATVALARSEGDLPGECRIVIRVGDDRVGEIVQHPDRGQRRPVRSTVVSRESAIIWAVRACREATRDGLVSAGHAIPHTVSLASMLPLPGTGLDSEPSTAVAFAADADGPVALDLVAHGPHAVVGGTTGSGKSELLISWVLALAARNPPGRINFLLMDFKGGSAFDSLTRLPQTVGLITDLDAVEAARALASLKAEIKYRERMLAVAGARDIRQLPDHGPGSMPRLVIVADEFAAMLVDHPDLHPLFADIASRGRSLGVHLILSTQRPAGIVRDGVLANTDLRISLRVNNRADSSAVIGTDAAAGLPASALGRGVVSLAGDQPRLVQFAIASPRDVAAVASLWGDEPSPRRPWCEPLPLWVSRRGLIGADGEIAFGLSDLPHEQRRSTAGWDAARDGHVLVLGAAGSGKSTALASIARAGTLIPSDVVGAWDAVEGLDSARDVVVAIDDLDSLLARFPLEYRDAFAVRLGVLLRDGPARGIRLILAAQRMTADINPLASLVPSRVMLRHAHKSDFVMAGADGTDYEPALPPGGGTWRGNRVQVVSDPVPLRATAGPAAAPAASRDRPWAIVTSRVATLKGLLAGAGLDVLPLAELVPGEGETDLRSGCVVLGDVEQWQSRWGLLPTLRPTAEIMFDRCTIADYRALTRSRDLPPPLIGLTGVVWREGESGATRVSLPLTGH